MIAAQPIGTFSAADAEYYGFGKMLAYLSGTTTPVAPTASDTANKLRVGIVDGTRVSDGNPSIGGQF